MSTKYIREFNGLIPIMLQEEKLVELDWSLYDNDWLRNKEKQFEYSKITEFRYFYRHYGNGRIKHYHFGKGLLKREYSDNLCAIICEDKRVAVENLWADNYPQDFLRFKKMLKENGYNIKTDIVYTYSLEDFFFDPLAPTFQDYQEDFQREVSKEFILSQRPAIISSEEENVDVMGNSDSDLEPFWPELLNGVIDETTDLNDFNPLIEAC